nr:protein FAM83G isoform X1 [Pogona vitticeps]
MALSQVQCLDNSHVNWRSSESKPEFFYSEEQRLALEALVSKGPDAFYEVLKKENIRDFLSEPELKKILDSLETYDPGSEYFPRGDEGVDRQSQNSEQEPAPSLAYWPEKSDRSIPQLDLGWPETIAYRGVTRATVYMQPPMDYQPHIKEVVRKMICQAQKVIAVVMDMFTDVDIFKDLLEAGFKRKVAIYIIVDESHLKYFLQMCERAQMHTGHLKNLRVRTTGGTEFFTRSATRFKGALTQKFMFVDGDKATCGSYSFTWSAARTDRNVITVLSGQVVEAFDKQFQELYLMSRGVSLSSVPMDEEPEPEPLILPSLAPVNQDQAVMKRMVNPKYALVKAKSVEQIVHSKEGSEQKATQLPKAAVKGKAGPEGHVAERPSGLAETAPPIHPGLLNLEKANMFDYLPTWVEPDPEPGSEVLGYINIIDPKVKIIQPSQMNRIKVCDVSQASAQHRQKLKQKAQEGRRSNGRPTNLTPSPHQLEKPCPKVVPNQETSPNLVAHPVKQTCGHPANGGGFATVASNGQPSKQPHDAQPEDRTDHGVAPPIPKPRTVPVTDFISMKTAQTEEGGAPQDVTPAQPSGADGANADVSPEGSQPVSGTGNSRALSRQAAVSQVTPVNGVQGGAAGEDEEEEDYVTVSDQESCSGSSAERSHRHSDASSVSEECFEVRSHPGLLRRTNSDFLVNGGTGSLPPWSHLQRKLSEPHMSRGTFVSPLGSPQPTLGLALEEARQKRREGDGGEDARRVLGRGHHRHALPDGYNTCPSNAPQGSPLFCYGTRVQGSGQRGRSGSQPGKGPEDSKYPRDGTRVKKLPPGPTGQAYWQSKTFTSPKNSQPGRSPQGGRGGPPRAAGQALSPFHESQRAPEDMKTPLGIPLSKLSQTKHLKSKVNQWSDSKRKPQGPMSHKDP